MEVIIRPDENAAAVLVAQMVAKEIRANPSIVLGLATGRTMEARLRRARADARKGRLGFFALSHVQPRRIRHASGPNNSGSYRYYMNDHLFDHVNIDPRNTHLPDGKATDLDKECERYEELIERNGGIDLQLLGVGKAGHIGFNEPLSALRSRTRVKALTPTTREQNAAMFGGPDKVPPRAITMGVGTILECRKCILMATGKSKADIIAKSVEGPITSMISATALQLHRKCTVVVDEDAASKLAATEYYRWIFENEPEWQDYQ